MVDEVKILDAKPQDAHGIINVFYKSWLHTYPNEKAGITVDDIEYSYKDAFEEGRIKDLEDKIINSPNNVRRLVAKSGDTVVGALTVIRPVFESEEDNILRTIYILPEYESMGIGTRLWNEARKFLDKNKDTKVLVTDYTKAVEFYKKLGFVDTGKRIKDEENIMRSGAYMTDIEMKLDKSLLK